MQFRYATSFDYILILLGTIAAIAHGTALPLLLLYFGDLTNIFISQSATLAAIDFLKQFMPNLTDVNCNSTFNASVPPLTLFNFSDTAVTITDIVQLNFTQGMCLLNADFIREIDKQTFAFLGIGAAVLILAYIQISFFQTSAERQVYKIRLRYYRAVLRQDIAWFDVNPTGEVSTRLSEYVHAWQREFGRRKGRERDQERERERERERKRE